MVLQRADFEQDLLDYPPYSSASSNLVSQSSQIKGDPYISSLPMHKAASELPDLQLRDVAKPLTTTKSWWDRPAGCCSCVPSHYYYCYNPETAGLEEVLKDTVKSLVVYHVSSHPLHHRERHVVVNILWFLLQGGNFVP